MPFEVPSSWVWCRLDDIVSFQGGYAYKSNTYVNQSDWQVIRIGNVKNDNLILDIQPVFVEDVIGKTTEKYLLKKDDILFTMTGTKGKRDYFYTAKVPSIKKNLLLNQRVGCLRCFSSEINIDFLCLVLKGEYVLDAIFSTETGNVSQGNIGSESTLNLNIAIPPLTEQHRIVVEIEKWFALIDQIEQGKSDLQSTIKQTKSKILDLAIHGKLVPQDPNDEPASELLKRINPNFTPCDNGHSGKLPQGWCYCNYKDVFSDVPSKAYQILQSDIQNDGKYPVISQSVNYIEGYTNTNNVFQHKIPCIIFGDHTRNVKYVDFDFVVGADGVKILCPKVNVKWSFYMIMYASSHIENKGYSRHFGQIIKFSYKLPPIAEQQRIVQKIGELFSVLDNIQKALEV